MAGPSGGAGDGGHRHNDAFELKSRPEELEAETEPAAPPAPALSNHGRELQAANDRSRRGDTDANLDDMQRQFATTGAPPMPPPPALGGDDEAAAARVDVIGDGGDEATVTAADRTTRAARKAPPLPAPPAPVHAITRNPWLRRRPGSSR